MNIGKNIGLLVIEAILGYGLSLTENATQEKASITEEVLSSQALVDETTPKIKDDTDKNKVKELTNSTVQEVYSKKLHSSVTEGTPQQKLQAVMDRYFYYKISTLSPKEK